MLKKMLAAALSVVMCISICACSNSSDTNPGDDDTTQNPTKVKVTLDNWEQYFEFKTDFACEKDSFGEYLPEGTITESFGLKEEYESCLNWDESSVIAVEIAHENVGFRKISFDVDTGKYVVGDAAILSSDIPEGYYYSCEYLGVAFEEGGELKETFDYRGYENNFEKLLAHSWNDSGVFVFYAPMCSSHSVTRISGTLAFEGVVSAPDSGDDLDIGGTTGPGSSQITSKDINVENENRKRVVSHRECRLTLSDTYAGYDGSYDSSEEKTKINIFHRYVSWLEDDFGIAPTESFADMARLYVQKKHIEGELVPYGDDYFYVLTEGEYEGVPWANLKLFHRTEEAFYEVLFYTSCRSWNDVKTEWFTYIDDIEWI